MIIKIEHISYSSQNFTQDINHIQNFGYKLKHRDESLINLENKKKFLRNYYPTQKFGLLEISNEISIEILEYNKKFPSSMYMRPHVSFSDNSKLQSLKEFNFKFNIADKEILSGLGIFKIDIFTSDIEKSEHFWEIFGFKREEKVTNGILSMIFNSPFTKQTFGINLILDNNQEESHFLDDNGFNCLAFLSTSIENERKKLKSNNIFTSDIQSLKIGNTNFDVLLCKSDSGEIVEIIHPKNSF